MGGCQSWNGARGREFATFWHACIFCIYDNYDSDKDVSSTNQSRASQPSKMRVGYYCTTLSVKLSEALTQHLCASACSSIGGTCPLSLNTLFFCYIRHATGDEQVIDGLSRRREGTLLRCVIIFSF
jgi:hypothetical protein